MFSKIFFRSALAKTFFSSCKDGHNRICCRWTSSNCSRVLPCYQSNASNRAWNNSYVGRRLLSTDIGPLYDQALLLNYVKETVSGHSSGEKRNKHEELQDAYSEYVKTVTDLQELKSLQSGLNSDGSEMEALVQEEEECEKRASDLMEQMVELVLPLTPRYDDIVVEIQSSIGGKESMLFAYELYDMYRNLALLRGWDFLETLDRADGLDKKLSVIRKAHILMSGYNIYDEMKYEGGIHRVIRVPETDGLGKTQTSTVIITVLPKPKEVDIELDPKDLKVDTFRSSGPGGQNVNKNDTAVRVTHMPTGVRAERQVHKTQYKNKALAIEAVKERLYQMEFDKQLMEAQRSRKIQIGTATYSDRIRTYNFSRDRVTDHRINYSTQNLPEFMRGGEPFQKMVKILGERSKYEILNEILETFQIERSLKKEVGDGN